MSNKENAQKHCESKHLVKGAVSTAIKSLADGEAASARVKIHAAGQQFPVWMCLDRIDSSEGRLITARTNDGDLILGDKPRFHVRKMNAHSVESAVMNYLSGNQLMENAMFCQVLRNRANGESMPILEGDAFSGDLKKADPKIPGV